MAVTDFPLIVQAVPTSRAVELSPSDTYLIVGGLGGIGRSIATWMIDRGARNLVLLSRSADSLSQETLNWLQGLRNAKGAVVRVEKCDVGDRDQLALTLDAINATMPTVKGVMQAAMVLRVGSVFSLVPASCRYLVYRCGSDAISGF